MFRQYNNLDSVLDTLSTGKLQRETFIDSVFNKYRLDDLSNSPNKQFVRLWENDKIIGAIDVVKEKDRTKIGFISAGTVADFDDNYKENVPIFESLLAYADNRCKQNNSSKIVVDVHGNLGRYKKQFESRGFFLNGTHCIDNNFWVEAEKFV